MEHLVMRLYDAGCRVEKHVRQVQRTRGHFMGLTEPFRRQVLVAQVQPATGYRRIPQLCDAALIGKECLVGQTWIVEPAYEDDLTASENRWTQAVRVQRVARADGCIWSCERRTGSAVDVIAPLERFKA